MKCTDSVCFVLVSFMLLPTTYGNIEFNEKVNIKCPVQDTNADIILGGVLPVHVAVSSENCQKANLCGYMEDVTRTCTRINKYGIVWTEAMIQTIKRINEDNKVLPGVKLGYVICDCYNSIERAFNISLLLQSLRHRRTSTGNTSQSNCSCNSNDTRTIVGIIGGASSKISMSINYIMNVFNIPQISYSSTSPSLSDKFSFRTFFRTIPPDTYQGKALVDIVKHFGWSYISTVATSDDYGRLGIEAFKEIAKSMNICLAVEALFDITLSLPTTKDQIRKIVSSLKSEEKAKVIILFCEWPSAQALLHEAERQNLTGRTWIASEAWGENTFVFSIREDVIGGMLGLIPLLGEIEQFRSHVLGINPLTYSMNPWFKEYAKSTLKCKNLTENSNASMELDYSFSKTANVMDAVNAIAYALHQELGCASENGAAKQECSWLQKRNEINLQGLLEKLKMVNFTGDLGLPVSFDANGDILGNVDIFKFSL